MPTPIFTDPLPPVTSAIAGIIQSKTEDNLAGYAVLDMSRTLIDNWQKHERDTPDSNVPQAACQDISDIITILQAIQTGIGTLRTYDIRLPSEDIERIISALTNMADCDEDNHQKKEAQKSKRIATMLRATIKKP